MKISTFVLIVLFPILVWGQASFDKANELYQQENYKEAAQLYEELLASGKHSADVYFNLGNAYCSCYIQLRKSFTFGT